MKSSQIAYLFGFDFATVVADGLEDFLDLGQEAVVVDRLRKLDDTEVTGTDILVLFTGCALEIAIDSTKMRIVRASFTGANALLIPVLCIRLHCKKEKCHSSTYIVSGYSMSMTASRSDSWAEKRPKRIS